jgi:hypothetical protein
MSPVASGRLGHRAPACCAGGRCSERSVASPSFVPKANSAHVVGVPRMAARSGRRCPRAHDRVQPARTPRRSTSSSSSRRRRLIAPRVTHHVPLLSRSRPAPSSLSPDDKIFVPGSGVTVDASCNSTITVSCLKQLYNAVNYVPTAAHKNAIGLTGYLEQFCKPCRFAAVLRGSSPSGGQHVF